jgi:hypothetical protein
MSTDRIPPGPPAVRRWLRRIRTFVLLLPFLLAGGAALWVWAALHFTYSTGDRAGYDQHLGLPSCFGETGYFVKAARRVEP